MHTAILMLISHRSLRQHKIHHGLALTVVTMGRFRRMAECVPSSLLSLIRTRVVNALNTRTHRQQICHKLLTATHLHRQELVVNRFRLAAHSRNPVAILIECAQRTNWSSNSKCKTGAIMPKRSPPHRAELSECFVHYNRSNPPPHPEEAAAHAPHARSFFHRILIGQTCGNKTCRQNTHAARCITTRTRSNGAIFPYALSAPRVIYWTFINSWCRHGRTSRCTKCGPPQTPNQSPLQIKCARAAKTNQCCVRISHAFELRMQIACSPRHTLRICIVVAHGAHADASRGFVRALIL